MNASHRPTLAENRLVLLLLLDRLGPCTEEQLLALVSEDGLLDYIDLRLGLADLTDAGLLRTREHEIGRLYILTQQGRDTLGMFPGHIPPSRRARVEALCARWKDRVRMEKHVLADWQERPDGFVVRLRLLEQDMALLDLQLNVPTRAQAGLMCRRWPERAGELYAHLVRALGEDDAPSGEVGN